MIDDEKIFLDTLSRRLSKQGYQVTTASHGKEGLDRFLDTPDEFDLILSDIQMPVMDGLEVLKQLRHKDYDVPVIIMTGHSELEKSIQALRLGAFDYLLKPLDLSQLYTTLQKLKSIRSSLNQVNEILPHVSGTIQIALPSRLEFIDKVIAYIQREMEPICRRHSINIYSVSLCLQEALANAVIHGNLDIQSHLKEESWEKFEEIRLKREQDSDYGGKEVQITYSFDPDFMRFEITDQGKGFDPSSLPDFTNPATLLSTGRGLLYISSFMDRVVWNKTGNSITMEKHLNQESESENL